MVAEYRAVWTVPGGGTGYSVFHFADATSSAQALTRAGQIRTFFNAIAGRLPNDISLSFEGEMRNLNTATGALTGVFSFTAPAPVPGAVSSNWAGAAGAVVQWDTGVVAGGRRQRGRTFIVPLAAVEYDTNGTLSSATISGLQTAANALITGLGSDNLHVWSRTNGFSNPVTSATIPDRTAILRGRRD